MARSTSALRAVKTSEPAKRTPMTVADAAKSEDQRKLLVAMRDRIAKAVSDPDCPPRDLASLSRRLQEIAKEIAAIDQRMKREIADGGADVDEAWDDSAI